MGVNLIKVCLNVEIGVEEEEPFEILWEHEVVEWQHVEQGQGVFVCGHHHGPIIALRSKLKPCTTVRNFNLVVSNKILINDLFGRN